MHTLPLGFVCLYWTSEVNHNHRSKVDCFIQTSDYSKFNNVGLVVPICF